MLRKEGRHDGAYGWTGVPKVIWKLLIYEKMCLVWRSEKSEESEESEESEALDFLTCGEWRLTGDWSRAGSTRKSAIGSAQGLKYLNLSVPPQ